MADINRSTDKDHPKQQRYKNPAWPFQSTAKPLESWDGAKASDVDQSSEKIGSMEHAGTKEKK